MDQPPRANTAAAPLDAVLLACSWTWVIGMLLPALLIEGFGWVGWILFAIPNVAGAASVGFLLRSPEHARAFARAHRPALALFALATVTLHGYVLGYLPHWGPLDLIPRVGPLATDALRAPVAALALALLAWALTLPVRNGFTTRRVAALAALALSAACVALAWQTSGGGNTFSVPHTTGPAPAPGVVGLALALALGFLTCPLLDPTLLRVRAETNNPRARAAFALGFLLVFPALILLTAFYAGNLRGLFFAETITGALLLSFYIPAHIFVQSVFTVALHRNELRAPELAAPRWMPRAAPALFLAAALAGGITPHLPAFDAGYKLLLGAWAIAFPAYVWCLCVPWPAPRPALARAAIAGALVAAPFFAYGALLERWVWLAPAALAVFLAPPAASALSRSRPANLG